MKINLYGEKRKNKGVGVSAWQQTWRIRVKTT